MGIQLQHAYSGDEGQVRGFPTGQAAQPVSQPEVSYKSADAIYHEAMEEARKGLVAACLASGLQLDTAQDVADEVISRAEKAMCVLKARSS